MNYPSDKLPDFFSVRNYDQINYSLEGMEVKKCYCFFDNGFKSNIIEPNKRDMRFIWDGFLLFTDKNTSLDDIRNGADLYNDRLVALQRTNALNQKMNTQEVREYILSKLSEKNIPYEIINDKNEVTGYPSQSDLWSTRDFSVLLDAIDTVGEGNAYYFQNSNFQYELNFNETNIPTFRYSHNGAIVLRGENGNAIARLILNDDQLRSYLEETFGQKRVYSYLEGDNLRGTTISDIEENIKKVS